MKLLIISLSAGAGHVRAADAIKKTAEQSFPSIEVEHIDMADYISLTMKKTVISSYAMMVKTLPELYGFLYNQTNKPQNSNRLNKITKQLKSMNCSRFFRYLESSQPDMILCTHCLASDLILNAPAKYQIKAPVSVVITDYALHNLWLVPGTAHYFVATNKMKWKMKKSGIDENKITVSGIPIDPVFFEEKSIEKLKLDHHIMTNKKVVLVMSGGQGMGKSDKIVKMLVTSTKPLSIIAIAGRNKHLEKLLNKIKYPDNIDLRIIGWTNQVDEYMRLADIIVTKSGGITTTECIASNKPMIIIDPIPGQEEHNADYILSNNLGFIARNTDDLLYYVESAKGGQGYYSPQLATKITFSDTPSSYIGENHQNNYDLKKFQLQNSSKIILQTLLSN